jgi:hypothetical protein
LAVSAGCVLVAVAVSGTVLAGLRADASVLGTFDDPGKRCPSRVEYVVDGTTYDLDLRQRWCGRSDQGSTRPQRVFYDSEDPSVALLADPGGPVPVTVVHIVVVVLLVGATGWLQWFWWWRQRSWWSATRS